MGWYTATKFSENVHARFNSSMNQLYGHPKTNAPFNVRRHTALASHKINM
jgi:hypothetical protein